MILDLDKRARRARRGAERAEPTQVPMTRRERKALRQRIEAADARCSVAANRLFDFEYFTPHEAWFDARMRRQRAFSNAVHAYAAHVQRAYHAGIDIRGYRTRWD